MPVAAATAAAVQASREQRPGRRRTSRSCSTCRPPRPGSSSSPRTSPVDDGARRGVSDDPAPVPRPGTWGSTTRSGSTSTGCATTGSAGRKAALEGSECGAFLLFDFYNIRYTTQTWIGGALGDKMTRYALLARGKDPVLWDFGSAVKHHKQYSPWVPDGELPGRLPRLPRRRRAVGRADGRRGRGDQGAARRGRASRTCRSAWTSSSRRSSSRCSGRGCTVVDAQQLMLDARLIKSADEIMLLNQAAAMVDGVYQDIVEALKPGVRENEIVALANKRLYEMGSDQVEAVNAISGERCNPHPHNFTDRLIRPGDQAFFDIIHSFNGYRTCYYRTFAVGQRDAGAARRLHEGARVDGPRHRRHQGRRRHRRGRRAAAGGRGVRVRQRDGGVRPAVRARPRPRPARAADHLPAQQHEGAGRAPGRHGVRAGDLLPGHRRRSRPRGSRRRSSSPRTAPQVLTLFPAQDLVVANPY